MEITQKDVKDARELLSSRSPVKNFPTITFTEEKTTSQTAHPQNEDNTSGTDGQLKSLLGTQTDASEERPEMQEQFVSRITQARRNVPRMKNRPL